MAGKPLVSVGVPTCNRAALLGRALKSLVAQDYPNLEIVVSDNASTDDTTAVCADMQASLTLAISSCVNNPFPFLTALGLISTPTICAPGILMANMYGLGPQLDRTSRMLPTGAYWHILPIRNGQ